VKGYRLIELSLDRIIIEQSVKFEKSVSHAPQQLHVGTFIIPHVRDDEHAHVEYSSEKSSNLEDLDDLDSDSVQSNHLDVVVAAEPE
jgi:hypothetical protein